MLKENLLMKIIIRCSLNDVETTALLFICTVMLCGAVESACGINGAHWHRGKHI